MITDFIVGPFILMYHSIADDSDEPYTVSVDTFREQLSWLSEHGFEVIPLSFLVKSMQEHNYKILRKKVVITFDDGYKDFVTNALPVLLDYGAAATVFLVTDMLGGRASWSDAGKHVQLMSEDEVRFIKAQGISLGSHTATHAKLTLLDHEDLQRQLSDSYNTLKRLGETFYTLSYPWGQWSNQIADAVKASGYECALAVGEKPCLTTADIYFLPRITMRRDMDIRHFRSMLTRTTLEIEMRRRWRILRMGLGRLRPPAR
jgi:peptidoglycan/xylan/chitin deacetylase (PgdA/CDA1 family)